MSEKDNAVYNGTGEGAKQTVGKAMTRPVLNNPKIVDGETGNQKGRLE